MVILEGETVSMAAKEVYMKLCNNSDFMYNSPLFERKTRRWVREGYNHVKIDDHFDTGSLEGKVEFLNSVRGDIN
jgi:hypothetical protein